jgi:hypothetical protein
MPYSRKTASFLKTLTLGIAALGLAAALPQTAHAQIVSGFNTNSLGPTDDGSTGAVSLGFTTDFFGTNYNSVYVNNNGNVTFTAPLSAFTPDALSTPGHIPIIAPFFADVYTISHGSPVTYGTGTYAGHAAFGVDYLNVGRYGDSGSTGPTDNFQVIMVDRSDIAAGDSDIIFNYGSMQWDTGSASGGVSADVGYTNGTGVAGTFSEVTGSRVTGAFLDGGPDALNGRSFSYQVRDGNVSSSALATPEPSSVAAFAFTALGAAGLMLKARKRKAITVNAD